VTYTSLSYWKHALFSKEPGRRLLADVGAAYLGLQLLDFFKIFPRDRHSLWTLAAILAASALHVLYTVRPVRQIEYKLPKRDLCIVVRTGDILSCPGQIVISTNTTFDTDMASGLIAPSSLQGQFALRYFNGKTDELDRLIAQSLKDTSAEKAVSPGKRKRYPIGTVAKVSSHGQNFYFLAMAELNEHGNAKATIEGIERALDHLWEYVATKGELGDLVLPLVGTGRGRVDLPRKKIIERIAQSFAYASREHRFANRLTIVVHRDDAKNFDLNLFEIRDYLVQTLHI
jgi:hypothetical protein